MAQSHFDLIEDLLELCLWLFGDLVSAADLGCYNYMPSCICDILSAALLKAN